MTKNLNHHEFAAEWVDDGQGAAVMLTQSNGGGYEEPDSVMLHPWQLRATCEHFGIIASDQQAAKTIATLTRRLKLLSDRVSYLADYPVNHSDTRHADLTYEQTYARATADIANEFCIDLADGGDAVNV